jgi:hypothetical protein
MDEFATAEAPGPSKVELLELDIDIRIADLWIEAHGVEDWNLDKVAAFIRAAYGRGYCDSLAEERVGALCEDHGYTVPKRGAKAIS